MRRLTLKTLAERGGAGVVGAALVVLSPVRALARADAAPDEVRAVVAEMLADAETRSSLLADAGGGAGHDGQKFFISDGGFKLTIGAILQTRYILNFREQTPGTDDFDSGFQRRRLKLYVGADLPGGWRADVIARFIASGDAEIETTAVTKKFEDGFQVKFGQFREQFLREEVIVDARQGLVERSVPTFVFGQGYPQGVEFSHTGERLRLFGSVNDGLRSENTDFDTRENTGRFVVTGEAEYGVSGRADLLLGASGAWKRFEELNPQRGGELGAQLGAGVHWQQSANTDALTDTDRDSLVYTADALVEGDSWNVFGAFVGRWTQLRGAGDDRDLHDFGATVQAGWRAGENWDLIARWEAVYADAGRGQSGTDWNFVTFGGNYYFAGHATKLSADVVWSINDTSGLRTLGVLPNVSLGLLGSAEENEVVARVQLQLVF